MALFADASFFVAVANPKDRWHRDAAALARQLTGHAPLRTHALAVGEVVALVGAARGGKVAQRAFVGIRDTCSIHLPSLEDLDGSMEWVLRSDGALSLSDSLFLRLMSPGRDEILSFDADFDGKGVRRIHQPPAERRGGSA